jgi:ribose transport system substrate-binding protein
MVLVPLGQAADTGPVERAMAAGIKVILCDSKVNSDNYTSLVNPNPATATVPLAQWLAKKMNYQGNLLYIGGLPGNGTTILYDQGFYATMKKYPKIKIVNGGNANYSISTAKQLTATAIASGKKFGGTWGVGGEAATGILQAYIDAKIKPIPPNAGAAATNGSLRLAIQNNVQAAMLQFPPADSKVCIETAAKAIKGQKVPKNINISTLPQYGNIYPPLKRYYKPQYSDDLYVGTDAVLTKSELASIHLTK